MSRLLLFPNLIGGSPLDFSPRVQEAVLTIDGLIAESEREGRRFLSHFPLSRPTRSVPIALIGKRPTPSDLAFLLEPIEEGETWGFVSDAGMPCLADPGASLVRVCRKRGLKVEAFSGPSSVMLAHVLSGLPAQRFAFWGYLPRHKEAERLAELERRSARDGATQSFIEAPYKNRRTLSMALNALQGDTLLCVACDLTLATEWVVTRPVKEWSESACLDKRPAIFLLNAAIH